MPPQIRELEIDHLNGVLIYVLTCFLKRLEHCVLL